jgi:nucleoside-diphosphate-sugar epimerase
VIGEGLLHRPHVLIHRPHVLLHREHALLHRPLGLLHRPLGLLHRLKGDDDRTQCLAVLDQRAALFYLGVAKRLQHMALCAECLLEVGHIPVNHGEKVRGATALRLSLGKHIHLRFERVKPLADLIEFAHPTSTYIRNRIGVHAALQPLDVTDGPGCLVSGLRATSDIGKVNVMRVFVAGGTGVIGRQLVPQLVARGHQVTATTTNAARLGLLRELGADGVVMDGLDAASVGEAVAAARPDAIVNEMTALSQAHAGKPNLRNPDRFFAGTNRLRSEGTDHLLAAAQAVGVSNVVAQSAAISYGPREGGPVMTEEDPLQAAGTKMAAGTQATGHLEDVVVSAGGAALRYGALYGPGATDDQVTLVRRRMFPLVGGGTGYFSWVHTTDAACATVLAVEQQATGVFNIVDDEPAPASAWLPYLAACAGAKPPRRIPAWLARMLAGEMAVGMMTEGRGFSNARAKRELGWELRYPSWRQGYKDELT